MRFAFDISPKSPRELFFPKLSHQAAAVWQPDGEAQSCCRLRHKGCGCLFPPCSPICALPCLCNLSLLGRFFGIALSSQLRLFCLHPFAIPLARLCVRAILLLPQYPLGFAFPLLTFQSVEEAAQPRKERIADVRGQMWHRCRLQAF